MKLRLGKLERNSERAVFLSVFLGLLLFGIAGFLAISNWKINQKRTELNSRAESLNKEIQILEERNKELQARILRSSEESFLEKEAREKFNLKKPGEEAEAIIILPSPESKNEEKKSDEEEKSEAWIDPLDWLFNRLRF